MKVLTEAPDDLAIFTISLTRKEAAILRAAVGDITPTTLDEILKGYPLKNKNAGITAIDHIYETLGEIINNETK